MGNYVSYSQISTHRSCPQKFYYSYVRKLEKVDPNDAPVELQFGLWWHAIRSADSIERGIRKKSLQAVPTHLSGPDGYTVDVPPLEEMREDAGKAHEVLLNVWKMIEHWEKNQTHETLEEWVNRVGQRPVERLRYVSEEYEKNWKEQLAEESPLAVEYGFTRELGNGSTLPGYVDEILLDERRNIVIVRDHKTHKTLDNYRQADAMMESQLQLYAWGVSKDVKEWGFGAVRATGYDRVCMTAPKTPKLTNSGKLSASVTKYDLRTYLEWSQGPEGEGVPYPGLKKDGSGAGVYVAEESKINELSNPQKSLQWFQRSMAVLNRNVVRMHVKSAAEEAESVQATRERASERNEAHRNMTSMGCTWCPFLQLCKAEMVGGPNGEYDLAAMYLQQKSKSSR